MQQWASPPSGYFFRRQTVHLAVLLVLLVAVIQLVDFGHLRGKRFFGVGAHAWFTTALAVPSIHQVYVWLG